MINANIKNQMAYNNKYDNLVYKIDDEEFNLIDNEDLYIPRVPRPILWLRHIDRINKISAEGEVQAYINSVNQFEALIPEKDDKYKRSIKIEEEEKNKSIKLIYENDDKKIKLELEFHLQKFRLLIELLKRKNMY